MSDHLTDLLHRAADPVDVPGPDVDAIIGAGRRRQRVRRGTEVLTVVLVVAVVALASTVLRPGGTPRELTAQQRYEQASPSAAYSRYGAFSSGKVVYVGNHRVTFDDKIKAIYYTADGVLVRAGRSAYTDSSGASRYTLIHPDGSLTKVSLTMGDRVPGTDPESPNI